MHTHQDLSKSSNLSFWELESYFTAVDFLVVGGGIVGLNAALYIKQQSPAAKVLVIERGILPYGASTKNAGFACFGSASEIMADVAAFGEELAIKTIDMRIKGLHYLRSLLGDESISYDACGGYELFFEESSFECYQSKIDYLNQLYQDHFGLLDSWSIASEKTNGFGFKGVHGMLLNHAEGSIDTGKMMGALFQKCIAQGVMVINHLLLTNFSTQQDSIDVEVNHGFTFKCKKMVVATNGFANSIVPSIDVKPARAQVLITKPIEGLAVRGTFHFDEGYYYFRNVGNRILFGGGRNLDIAGETSSSFELNQHIQQSLDNYLHEVILPNQAFEIEHRWTGIMGVGESKMPIIRNISERVSCAVKMGGMGLAIGSLAGVEAAKLVL
jgi:glycine/D-amino acid oxidase-like deaminating enzyme